jgi:hypothetical protein
MADCVTSVYSTPGSYTWTHPQSNRSKTGVDLQDNLASYLEVICIGAGGGGGGASANGTGGSGGKGGDGRVIVIFHERSCRADGQ